MWATIFFVMLLVLGVDSEFCNVEALVTGIVDNWPDQLLKHRRLFTVCLCLFLFCLGIPLVTSVGYFNFGADWDLSCFSSSTSFKLGYFPLCCLWYINLLIYSGRNLHVSTDGLLFLLWHGSALGLLLPNGGNRLGIRGSKVNIGGYLCRTKCYFFRFCDCVEQMTGHKPNIFWYLCWKFFAPAVMLAVFIFYCISYTPVTYGEDYKYPKWAEGMGLCMSFTSMIWVPGYAIYYLLTQPGTLMQVHHLTLIIFALCLMLTCLTPCWHPSYFQNLRTGISPNMNLRKEANIAIKLQQVILY